jgi:hypothetical protein
MTPQLQISTAGVYLFPAKTSGAKNRIEENTVVCRVELVQSDIL